MWPSLDDMEQETIERRTDRESLELTCVCPGVSVLIVWDPGDIGKYI
jgi:hypothetical protein